MSYNNDLSHDLLHLLGDHTGSGFQESGGIANVKKLVLANRELGAYL